MGPPVLERLNNAEMYSIDVPAELELYNYPSVVFRIEVQPGEYIYQWMVDVSISFSSGIFIMDFLLDLSTFTGQPVQVSYAFATEDGFSEYSEATEVNFIRDILPVSPNDSVHTIITKSAVDAKKTAFCHISCLHYALVLSNINTSNSSNSSLPGIEREPLVEVCLLPQS